VGSGPDRPQRLLVAIPSLLRGGDSKMQGGPEGVIFTLLDAFDRHRFEVHLAVDDVAASDLIDLIEAPLQAHSVAASARDRIPQGRYPAVGLAAVARRVQPDVVLSTLRMNATSALARPLLPKRTAIVARLENNVSGALESQKRVRSGLRVRGAEWLHGLVPRRATLLIAQSRSMADDLEQRHEGRYREKTRTLPNPVDVDAIRARGAEPVRDDFNAGRPHLVSVGRLHHQKGYDVLLPAFARLLESHPSATLRILGEGPDRGELVQQAAALGVRDRIDFHGFVSEPLPYVAAADLYVCSSRYEGFSNALAEAAALGVPMVAPTGPAAGDEIVNERNGRLVQHLSEADLVEALTSALATPFDRRQIAEECGQRFSVVAVARKYEAVLSEAIERRTAAAGG
jgi:glycosyltransferase involved in cell wall biosynthesis